MPVQRPRLPRGRTRAAQERGQSSQSHTDLNDRVAKIEHLLEVLVRDNRAISISPTPETATAATATTAGASASPTNGTFPLTFNYGTTLFGLLNSSRQNHKELSSSITNYLDSERDNLNNDHLAALQMRSKLCQVYLDRVDPVFKILHRPSLREFMVEGKPYLDYELQHEAPMALASAVCYVASCSLDNYECRLLFGKDKDVIVAKYQRQTEEALAGVDVVTTNDLSVLQAYILVLVSSPCLLVLLLSLKEY